jgi:catechol 2,3-dioxygenase-like lactoylglutathione lyase family enzyme
MSIGHGWVKGISELALWVSDLEESVAFYRDHLGFTVQEVEVGCNAVLHSGDLVLVLFVPESPGTALAEDYLERNSGPCGDFYHVGFRVEPHSLERFSAALRAQGLEVSGPVTFASGRHSYFLTDPDDHYIELTDR